MNQEHPPSTLSVLEAVRDGRMDVEEAQRRLGQATRVGDLGFARVDHDRARRCGFAEVVFGEGKTAQQITSICHEILTRSERVLVTRVDETKGSTLQSEIEGSVYDPVSRTFRVHPKDPKSQNTTINGRVEILCAGTSDLSVAEEARITAEIMDAPVGTLYDVGVAGLHRLLQHIDRLREASVLVVVAGMEGALPSVVGGLVDCPVIAVPTSVGYGASFGGLAALLGMLNSCAAGVSVVNINNGFGAGYLAALISRKSS